jgi:hypothetical protein
MTKIKQSDFVGDTITKVKKPKTMAQKLKEFRVANEEAYKSARYACCECAPSRAQILLIDKYDGLVPID